ncbi:MAG: hypothetical protein AAB381_01650 [Patescibacteria group bacterium]
MKSPAYTRGFVVPMLIFAIVVVSGISFYFYQRASRDPQTRVKQDASKLLAEIGAIVLLPTDEEPTIATITDPEKLKDQVFFANAKPGYKVLIYAKARKVFLYDPVGKRLIDAAPLYFGDEPLDS